VDRYWQTARPVLAPAAARVVALALALGLALGLGLGLALGPVPAEMAATRKPRHCRQCPNRDGIQPARLPGTGN